MDFVTRGGPVPLYRQVAGHLRTRIQAGELQPDERVPSENDICGSYGVARGTGRRAIEVLRDEGWVYTVPHMGTFVARRS